MAAFLCTNRERLNRACLLTSPRVQMLMSAQFLHKARGRGSLRASARLGAQSIVLLVHRSCPCGSRTAWLSWRTYRSG